MNGGSVEFQEYFRLRPTRAAKVSEISEATAASSAAPEDRVNFHIGNPVQEKRLSSAYLRAVLGLDIRDESLSDEDPASLLHALDGSDHDRPALELLSNLVRKSAPYLPRGGFARATPSPLAIAFSNWLQQQQEPLTYDLGKTTSRREIIFASGGRVESMRVLFHALSSYLVHTPAQIFLFRTALPVHCQSFRGLRFETLPDDEHSALAWLHSQMADRPVVPTFVVLGAQTNEETRRSLRTLSLSSPLFFIELNDAPNHLSLAREARLVNRVLRFLTPAILSPRFRQLSLVFVAGNAEYLSLLETLHFQLKGTPSASEVEILTFFVQQQPNLWNEDEQTPPLPIEPPLEAPGFDLGAERTLARHGVRVEQRVDALLRSRQELVDGAVASLQEHATGIVGRIRPQTTLPLVDPFSNVGAVGMVEEFTKNVHDRAWLADLSRSFLQAFVRHHSEYDMSCCAVVSGSSRTALSLLGVHCGIREVMIPDLSWTYEHCFPSVHAVPLTPEFGLDVHAILDAVRSRILGDPTWPEYGAVVLNNPHNATGRIFDIASVRQLLEELLGRGITVIDDLSYENVAPSDELPVIPTLRQLADEMVRAGRLSAEHTTHVITVHSLSKTDCLAGARLSVVEIRDPKLRTNFAALNETVTPNCGAILLTYLFYRNSREVARAYWRLRNSIFLERMRAIETAVRNLPADRNPFGIEILAPTGSMYPLMVIHRLPPGLSLDWVAAGLARQGIGMIPLSTFARTEKGFETGRKSFRLTLGGADGASILLKKTRRTLIDLNRLIAEEAAQYSRKQFTLSRRCAPSDDARSHWSDVERELQRALLTIVRDAGAGLRDELRKGRVLSMMIGEYVPDRLAVYRQRFLDQAMVTGELLASVRADRGKALGQTLQQEFYKDNLSRREEAFRRRLFDRTVHPTQMYSIRTEAAFNAIMQSMLRDRPPSPDQLAAVAREIVAEFLGLNVAITSSDEAEEIILDLDSHITAELFGEIAGAGVHRTLLSFWGDWDGSNRPSGQGHRLVGSVLLTNVKRLSGLLRMLVARDSSVRVPPELLTEIERLPAKTRGFVALLNEITSLTHQLERRYRGILPFQATPGRLRRIGMALHLARDPVTSLWYHNDRLERRMQELRHRRREALEYYFGLNKRLRKELHALIPSLQRHLADDALLRETVLYRDLLQRFLITPRIHQNMVTAQDPFAIDTTVFNISEINEISARYGNPGMVLALQVSMATRPEALIELDRKMRARREHILRDHPEVDLPSVWLVPLFEDLGSVRGIATYLNKLWEYSLQSRRLNQETGDRFAELIAELFIAGSDLSQHVGQAAGAHLYRQAKYDLLHWLAERGLASRVRLKLGSGEPMQRQGGYYCEVSGAPAFLQSEHSSKRFATHLRESARRSTLYATTPMLGVFAGGDLRTLQSAVAEHVRNLPAQEFAQLLHHLSSTQQIHRRDLIRASEEFADSRLTSTARGEQALERLTLGTRDQAFDDFLKILTENFRQILYGRDEDVVGIHVVSYFIARTTPPLRDRPTVRPGLSGKEQGNKILERIAETIPFSRYGSLLRAIAHNQAQTAVLGINQLTTGLFRALDTFSRRESIEGDPETFLADHILPHLPVYEILQSLRLYHDVDQQYLHMVARAFPAGNSALLALREDLDAMGKYIPLFQQELLRRHGIDISEFFEGNRFIPDLLPTVRPDLAVVLQPDLFNVDPVPLLSMMGGRIDEGWQGAVGQLLAAPREIRQWRSQAWALLERPVFQRVEAFVELAVALYSLSRRNPAREIPSPGRAPRLPSSLESFFRASRADDEMRQFLGAAMEYLTLASEGMLEVPATIIRAIREVERIAAIEEQALTKGQQDRLRFYLLQIARRAGENG